MSIDAVAKFVSLVALHFRKPNFEDVNTDEKIWFQSLARMIGHYGDEVLAGAADHILRTRDRKKDGAFFPVPSECIQACEHVKSIIDARSMPLIAVAKKPSEWSRERHELALAMMQGELGARSVRERWHGALYEFCYANQRLPRGAEIDGAKRVASEFDKARLACERGEVEWGAKPLAKLGANIVKRREKITALVNGGQNGNDA